MGQFPDFFEEPKQPTDEQIIELIKAEINESRLNGYSAVINGSSIQQLYDRLLDKGSTMAKRLKAAFYIDPEWASLTLLPTNLYTHEAADSISAPLTPDAKLDSAFGLGQLGVSTIRSFAVEQGQVIDLVDDDLGRAWDLFIEELGRIVAIDYPELILYLESGQHSAMQRIRQYVLSKKWKSLYIIMLGEINLIVEFLARELGHSSNQVKVMELVNIFIGYLGSILKIDMPDFNYEQTFRDGLVSLSSILIDERLSIQNEFPDEVGLLPTQQHEISQINRNLAIVQIAMAESRS